MPKVKLNLKPGTHWQDIHFHSHIMMDSVLEHFYYPGLVHMKRE